MHRIDVWRMIRRRAEKAGIDADMCCHTFRATGLTNFLANGGTLENAQAMADHASPRTTQLYDRTGDEVTLDEVEADRDLNLESEEDYIYTNLSALSAPPGLSASGVNGHYADGTPTGVRFHSVRANAKIAAVISNNPPAIIHSTDPSC